MSRYPRQRDDLLKSKRGLVKAPKLTQKPSQMSPYYPREKVRGHYHLSSPEPATPHCGQPVPSPEKDQPGTNVLLGVFSDASGSAHATLAVAERDL
ncbi:hypothetical protein NPIL_579801 [Nephila pilipes]|uniref:Uncharacterized protein n=2 Tax=Nephila pilipes TaxID=299642 RepID=A0A8X6J0J0_NEPPI|nr:hypothetical protein NPIL_579801 [Nephila pilipes]